MILHQQPLRTVYYILLTNSSLVTADTFCSVQKILFPIDDIRFLFQRKKYNPLHLPCPLFPQVTSCTPTKSNLYLANSLAAAAVSEPDLYRPLTFQVPNFIYYPHILRIILKKIIAKNMVHICCIINPLISHVVSITITT